MKDKITVGIHNTWPHRPDLISNVYRQILKANNINYLDLNSSTPDFRDKLRTIDYFIYRWAHTDYHYQHASTIIPIIENYYKIPCFPNWKTCWHYDDKIKQSLMLESYNYQICKSYVFWEKSKAIQWLNEYKNYPIVFKLKSGSGSLNVKLIYDKKDGIKLAKKMFNRGISSEHRGFLYTLKTLNYDILKASKLIGKSMYLKYFPYDFKPGISKQKGYFYFQEFYPNNEYDTRVQITGERAYAFVRYNRPNDFRASGSNNWDKGHDKINMEFVKIAFEISDKLGFQSMAYDFIYDKNRKPAIVEISYCFGDYPEFSDGYWDKNHNWHKGRFLPQYFELVDLLKRDDLILPDNVTQASSYTKVIV